MNSSKPPNAPVIPDHHLERRIGQGGYGEIWLARNVIGTYRAVKVVYRSQFDSPKPYEREFAGLKAFEPVSRNHPAFVDVLQVGRNDEAGYIYYVMELADDEVSGRVVDPDTYSAKTLAQERNRLGRLPADDCLQIAKSLAGALAYLHKAGLVHRDVKPSNIIFVNGQPKLADIGLVVSLSEARTYVGSDGYIPPEGPGTFQADIYSLGKLLYEISTGQHREQFPELPPNIGDFEDSTAVLELNEIFTKACENDLSRRYRTADDFRADIEMIIAGRSVKQLRFVERQLARVRRVAGVAILIAILAGTFAGVVAFMAHQKNRLLAESYVTSGVQLMDAGNAHAALPLFTAALRLQQGNEAAEEAHRLRIGTALARAPKLLQFWNHGRPVQDVCFSADGEQLVIASGRTVRLVDAGSGEQAREFSMPHDVSGASLSPDGKRIAVANGKFINLFDATMGEEIWQSKQHSTVLSAEFSPDGRRLVLGCVSSCAHLIDAATGRPAGELNGHSQEVSYAEFSPNGAQIITASRDGTAGLWEANTGRLVATLLHEPWVVYATFAPDGRHVATAGVRDNNVLVWDISEQPHVSARMEHDGGVQSLSFSPDGHWIVSASLDRTARLWNARTGKPASSVINLPASALRAVFSPEGRRVAVAGHGGQVRVWDVAESAPLDVGRGIVSSDGERYVTFTSNSFRVWRARDDSPVTALQSTGPEIASVSCSDDGKTIALCAPEQNHAATVYIYSERSNSTHSFDVTDARESVLLSPDGTKLLTTNGPVAVIWDTASGKALFERRDFSNRVEAAAFSPDNGTLALSSGKRIFVLDAKTGHDRFPPLTNSLRICWLVFSPDSTRLAGTGRDRSFTPGTAIIWDTRDGRKLTEFTQHSDGVQGAAFTRDRRTVATAGEDSLVFVWDARTGDRRFESLLDAAVRSVRVSSDDRWLSACSWRDAQLWELNTGSALTPGFEIPGPGVFDDSGLVAGKERLWVRASRGLLFWELPRAEESPDELFALASHLGVMIPAGISWNSNALPLATLRERCALAGTHAKSTLRTWHAQQARRFEHEKQWFAARFHLEQLIMHMPTDAGLRARASAAAAYLNNEMAPANLPSATFAP